MAILAFNGAAVHVLQDFTDKNDDLETVINKLFIADTGLDETVSDDSSADTGAAFGEDDSEFNLFTTDRALREARAPDGPARSSRNTAASWDRLR